MSKDSTVYFFNPITAQQLTRVTKGQENNLVLFLFLYFLGTLETSSHHLTKNSVSKGLPPQGPTQQESCGEHMDKAVGVEGVEV